MRVLGPTAAQIAAASSGTSGGGSLVLINQFVSTGVESSFSFNVPNTYTHLRLIGAGRSQQAGTGNDAVSLRLNGDSGANYARQWILGTGASVSAAQASPTTSAIIGELPTAGDISGYQGTVDILFPLYRGPFAKGWHGTCMTVNNTTIGSLFVIPISGAWSGTAIITNIGLTTTAPLVANSTFSLYGYK